MMKNPLFVFIVSLSLGSLSAQSFKVDFKNHSSTTVNTVTADTVKILAIMVNFQEDRDGTTFGNGKFESIYSANYGNSILDPIPHDDQYFKDHLLFVRNYFKKVSGDRLNIDFNVLPDTFSVSQTMRNYSPSPNSDDFLPLGNFAVEAWTLADQIYPGLDFSAYDVFTIFHAGVGRDISLPGSIGNERDLPSVYLSLKSFQDIFGENFDGIPVSGGSFKITNSMIMPETESRELNTVSGTVLFEITINGLIAASIGSHLGIPDLFDTETGLSAIGRFGLMDGQGIFAFSGTYPPEPSPWTKIFMGWAEPVTIELGNADVFLATKLAAEIGETVILKIPLNSSEYYLIENRNRDANQDGSIVTYIVNGSTITKNFTKDTTGYQSFDVDSLAGVIIDVDEFDWAIPGNGIVIWHIDENIINTKMADNKINTDKKRRGIDIEEADGIQDIGETFITIFGDEVVGEGTEEDFWYSSNPADLFQNKFAKDTRPNTLTNSGANSLITIKDFSAIDNRMSFKIEFGDSVVKPLFSTHLQLEPVINGFSVSEFANSIRYLFNSNNDLVAADDQNILFTADDFSGSKSASINKNNVNHIYGVIDSILTFRITDGANLFEDKLSIGGLNYISSQIVINSNEQDGDELLFGTMGKLYKYSLGNLPAQFPVLIESIYTENDFIIEQIAADGNFIAYIGKSALEVIPPTYFFESTEGQLIYEDEQTLDLIITTDIDGRNIAVVLTEANKIYVIHRNEILNEFQLAPLEDVKSFALSDLKRDGTNYIVLNNGNNIEVYNLTGAMADNFPFSDPEEIGFIGTPLTADFEGDNRSEIISFTKDGRIFAIDGGTGNVVTGFPISTGADVPVTPVLYNANGKTNLAVLNDQNILSAWSTSSVEGKLFWSEEFGNPQNTSFIDAAENTNRINEFFPTSRAYNYPNPVYEGETNIRYYVSEDSKINIKIFDLAGDFVAELDDDAQGGMDNETVWNVSNIQSGVYFARIEASASSGRTEQAIIKIAVVK
jgi:M6 family metalloprotease-like protein